MKNKTIFSFLAAAIINIGVVHAATTLRFGYEAPRSDTQHQAAKKFADIVKEKTGGDIKISLFPDSTLGNAQAMISGVRGGTIDIEMSGSPNFSGLSSNLNVIDIPFIFHDKAHAYRVLDGEIGQGLMKELEDKNLKGLAFWEVGFRAISNSKHPVKTPEDIKGLKIRTNQNPMYVKAFELLGANPVPMPLAELYTALETKTVDAQEHPIGILYSVKLYEVQKYLSLSNHGYTPLLVVMNKEKFDSLPSEQQQAILDAAKEAGNYQRQLNAEKENKMLDEMQSHGLEIIRDFDSRPFRELIENPVRQIFIEKNGDTLLKKVDAQAEVK
ncbi:MAG: TRAP transporter substrate-binding protein [Cardiobacteriaceae bacterium]|nr:TRAP transporter substrate-binding protein [Cardiobacteriaceae bacterium]